MWWLNVLRVQVYASVIAVPLWRKKGSVLEDARQQFEAKRMNRKSLSLFFATFHCFNIMQDLKDFSNQALRNFLTTLDYKHYGEHLFWIHISMPCQLLLPMAEDILISRFCLNFHRKIRNYSFYRWLYSGSPSQEVMQSESALTVLSCTCHREN